MRGCPQYARQQTIRHESYRTAPALPFPLKPRESPGSADYGDACTSAGQVMFPLDWLMRISPAKELCAALQQMDRDGVNQLPVMTAQNGSGKVPEGWLLREMCFIMWSESRPICEVWDVSWRRDMHNGVFYNLFPI